MFFVAATALILGLTFDLLFFDKTLGLSVLLFALVMLGLTLGLAFLFNKPLPRQVRLLMLPILFFALMPLFRASGSLVFFDVVAVAALCLLSIDLTLQPRQALQNYTLPGYIYPLFWLPLELARQFFGFSAAALSGSRGRKHAVLPVVRGMLLGLPIVAVFLILLSSADLVFQQYVSSLFSFSVSPELVGHLVLIGLITALFISGFTLLFLETRATTRPERTGQRLSIGLTEAYIVLGSVGLLFALFVLIQVTYLFGGQSHIMAAGLTYADYARRGFFELLTVAVIALGLILAFERKTIRSAEHKLIFNSLNCLLVVEVLLIMMSALKRLSLYEQAYGYTVLRLYSHLFLAWLALIFVCLVVHIFWLRRASQFALAVFVSALTFLGILNMANPDALVARQNVRRYQATGKIDVAYLASLSEDATPAISQLLDSRDEQIRQQVATQLHDRPGLDASSNGWQSFNVARRRAHQIIQQRQNLLNANYRPKTYPTLD